MKPYTLLSFVLNASGPLSVWPRGAVLAYVYHGTCSWDWLTGLAIGLSRLYALDMLSWQSSVTLPHYTSSASARDWLQLRSL